MSVASPEGDLMLRLAALSPATIGHHPSARSLGPLRPLVAGTAMTGRCLPVRIRVPDASYVHLAVDAVEPGDVIVIACEGGGWRAPVGGIIATLLAERGAGGIVIDGPVADSEEVAASGLPVFSRGRSVCTTYVDDGSGSLGRTIKVAGVSVARGDIVVGDDDGVLVIDPVVAAEQLPRWEAAEAQEADFIRQFLAGTPLGVLTGALAATHTDGRQSSSSHRRTK
ncbi:RraA family protein [Paenarthrobacter sp. NPDC090520]|uniref:RraA family protein n=1 Tax=Paenarthrobacter sp. NPDC090520 TaxID=3364382 RepID=UPI003824A566